MINLQTLFRAATAALLASATLGGALAQASSYPTRPIKLIVPFAAGGSSDILGRLLADKAGKELGQAVVVDNRAGGNTVIGTQAASSSRPDGYTVLQMTPNSVIVASLQRSLPYDIARDFAPVMGVGSVPLLLAVPGKSAVRSIADLVTLAKSSPGGVSYASGGIGSLGHLAPARFLRDLKISGTHVPYRGVAPAIQDVAAGRVHLMFVSSLEGMQMEKSGGIRVLAVTSRERLSTLPGVPTMAELGFVDFTPAVWYGFVVPNNTPGEIRDRLYKALAKGTDDPAVREKLSSLGLTIKIQDGAEFGKFVQEETSRWGQVVADNGVTMD